MVSIVKSNPAVEPVAQTMGELIRIQREARLATTRIRVRLGYFH